MPNPGKVFEEDFRNSAEAFIEVDVNRLHDPVGGAAGVRNICDFIVYMTPYIYYFELKSRQGNTLNFKEITKAQWTGLIKKSAKPGAIPGVIVNYSDHNESYFIHIDQMVQLRDVEGKKSVHIDFAREHGVKLLGERKRTRFAYYVKRFLTDLGDIHG
jgi:recombination protein U